MESIQIDWLVVLVAAVLNMLIGFLWYSHWLFGSAWAKLSKHSSKEMKSLGKSIVIGFIASIVTAFFLAFFEAYLGVTTVTDGMFVGFLLWLGFVTTTQISGYLWHKEPLALFFINTGYRLLAYLVMGGLIGA